MLLYVYRMRVGGNRLEGNDESDLRPQSWLCAVHPEDALPLLERVRISEWARDLPETPLGGPMWGTV